MNLWQAGVADLLLGVECAGCQSPGVSWCEECARLVVPEPFEVSSDTWAAGRWSHRLRSTILAWKLGHVQNLDSLLAWHVAAAVVSLDPPESISLVPVPTTWRSRRERGRHLVFDLCREVADLLKVVGVDACVDPVVRLRRQTRDQSGLSIRKRASNVHGAMKLARHPQHPVVIVDDIVTTGATLQEVRRVLSSQDCLLVGAATIAASVSQQRESEISE